MENIDLNDIESTYNKSEIYYNCNNDLHLFPQEALKIKKIKVLKLWKNKISEIPSEISELECLEEIHLTGNRLSSLPEEFSKFKNLKILNLGHNRFTEIPMVIFKLEKLEELYLFNNKIRSIPSEISNLKRLKILDLERNEISEIPTSAENLNLTKINLNENFLENLPIELEETTPDRIINYYAFLREKIKLFEAKLLIVGNGGVGKTCLLNKITNPEFQILTTEPTTEGIDIHKWFISTSDIQNFRINFWDFGGQEIYHSTHQFFLTKRSLYLFIWEARKEDNLISFDYWLNIINLLSNSSPIIIVQNKIDERAKLIDEQTIIGKFPNIIDFFKVSVKTGEGIELLRKKIVNEIIKLEHIGDVLPKVWINIRRQLEGSGENLISIEKYYEICKEYNLNIRQSAYLSKYFHDLGVFLHFSDNSLLREVMFLKPDWATNAVYKLIDTKSVIYNYGEFDFDMLQEIWSDYPIIMHKYFVELMKKFELCFELPKNAGYIIPELLLSRKPEFEWDNTNNLQIEYHYDFMPAGIITRFIVRIHDLILDDLYWKEGVVLKREKTKAMIVSEQINRKIIIDIFGNNIADLLSIIQIELDYIHNSLNNPDIRKMIPCNCKVCKTNKIKTLYDYDDLLIHLESDQKTIFCVKGKSRIRIDSLLAGFEESIAFDRAYHQINIEQINISGGQNNFIDNIIE